MLTSRGETLKGKKEIEDEIVNFYKNLYENYDRSNLSGDDEDDTFFNNLKPVPGSGQDEVASPITLEELTTTLRSCSDSAPGPDGIPYSYLGTLWPVIGPVILDAWHHSIRISKLCPSHKMSYLRLIPKAGKDLKKLTNWRPITLSNCDHKLITKTYASRMAKKVSSVIEARQTAYLKGKLINDNIRGLMLSIHLANAEEENIDGLLVSLDAKKAFDSVEHSYIEKCLRKFGLASFVSIFKVLYSELKSDILINGKIVSGYQIKRGVKQGDALSCILFIMCMEPLIANIEKNDAIETIYSIKLRAHLPKAYTYADDLNCAIKKSNEGLQAIFDEYSRLTKLAGLELNADKTEVMRFASELRGTMFNSVNYRISYLGTGYDIATVKETKINGILFQQDEVEMRTRNVDNVRRKMETQLKNWSKRGLSTLGKILIVKTFGISQIVFLLQSLTLDKIHFKQLNDVLYKFIWNKHFSAPKAPERIRREIINTPVKLGGFGMLDIVALDEGLKLRALGRLMVTEHPALKLIRERLDLSDFFFPKLEKNLDSYVEMGLALLMNDRQLLWENPMLRCNVQFISAVRACKIKNLIKPALRNNLAYFLLSRAGKTKVEHLTLGDVENIGRILLNGDLAPLLRAAVQVRLPNFDFTTQSGIYYYKRKWVNLDKLSSKEIRLERKKVDPICLFKCGLILDPSEGGRWLKKVNNLNNTGHKNALLRFVHGDIYSRTRLFRFGLGDSPLCERCNELETVNHKIFECSLAAELWKELDRIINYENREVTIATITGAYDGSTKVEITLQAELIARLIRNLDTSNINSRRYIATMVKALIRKEKGELKRQLENLLNET